MTDTKILVNFTTKDVVEIVKACRVNGVCAFSFGQLKFRLGDAETRQVRRKPRLNPEEELRRLPEMEMRVKQDELEELRLRDPYEYEQLIQQNELTNDRQADS